jgi:tol-pal system protein YbgF
VIAGRGQIAALLVAGALGAAGCATQADVQELAREQRRLSGRLADTRASLEAMQRDLARVRGGIDEVRHERGGRRALTPARVEALEDRVRMLEEAAMGPSPRPTPGGPFLGEEVGPRPEGEVSPEDQALAEAPEEYRQGVSLLRAGDYDRSIQAFRSFLRTNGDSLLAANAHYAIGESYFMLGDYYQAILNFNDVRQRYPSSDRAPAAVLKIGQAFSKMGNKTEARLAFQKVVKDFPSSAEAAEAREQLRALER